jgi:hypothetical protein
MLTCFDHLFGISESYGLPKVSVFLKQHTQETYTDLCNIVKEGKYICSLLFGITEEYPVNLLLGISQTENIIINATKDEVIEEFSYMSQRTVETFDTVKTYFTAPTDLEDTLSIIEDNYDELSTGIINLSNSFNYDDPMSPFKIIQMLQNQQDMRLQDSLKQVVLEELREKNVKIPSSFVGNSQESVSSLSSQEYGTPRSSQGSSQKIPFQEFPSGGKRRTKRRKSKRNSRRLKRRSNRKRRRSSKK